MRAVRYALVFAVPTIILLGGAFVLGRATAEFGRDAAGAVEAAPASQTFTVRAERIESSLPLPARVSWPATDGPRNRAAGTVTSVAFHGGAVEAGAVLYSVDERPVVVALGETPSYRDLTGGERGRDVAQLRRAMCALGHLVDCDAEADDFDANLERAVRAWHESNGVPDDGVVQVGELLYVPSAVQNALPGEQIAVGELLAGGEVALRVLPDVPDIEIVITDEQRALIAPGETPVIFAERWSGVVAGVEDAADEGEVTARLLLRVTGPSGAPICQTDCADTFPADTVSITTVDVEVVPETEGPAVPVAAVGTAADGSQFVTTSDGDRVAITVVAAAEGIAIVDGVSVGTDVSLGAAAAGSAETTDTSS